MELFTLVLLSMIQFQQRNSKITFAMRKRKHKVSYSHSFLKSESKIATTKTKLLETALDKTGITHPEKRTQLITAYFESFIFHFSTQIQNTTIIQRSEFYLTTLMSCFHLSSLKVLLSFLLEIRHNLNKNFRFQNILSITLEIP